MKPIGEKPNAPDDLKSTLIAVYGVFMTPIGWGWAMFVCGYALAWFFVSDRVKLLAYRFFDSRNVAPSADEPSNLPTKLLEPVI